MADDIFTISDFVADALDLSGAEVSDVVHSVPFLDLLPMEESSNGTTHKYAKETGAPVVGFRAENTGRDMDHSTDTVVSVALKILDFSWKVDKAVADVWRKGGAAALIAREGLRHIKSALRTFEKQVIYGTSALGSSDGFSGMVNAATVDGLADSLVVNAGGSAAGTGSSVWAVRVGGNDISGVYDGDVGIDLGETTVVDTLDGSGMHYPSYYTPGCTWLGLQVGSVYSMGRIVNLTEDSGKGLTDDLIADLLSRFPVGYEPTHLLMSRRSLRQLQDSRTATNATGAPAPFPQDSFGVPIVKCESIVNTEAILS